MLLVLSPAKALDYATPVAPALPHAEPAFKREAAELIDVLRAHSPAQIASLMRLSDALAALNLARYAAWRQRPAAGDARQAVLAFDGDVYRGLNAATLNAEALDWLQAHVAILSGLYGVLRPLDRIQPYRLEMGTRLATARGASLYQFWGARIAAHLAAQMKVAGARVLVNLASQEYFKAIDRQALGAPVLDCVFEDYRAGRYQVLGVHAKRARGLMARWAAEHRPRTSAALRGFDSEGYAHDAAASGPDRLVFRRRR